MLLFMIGHQYLLIRISFVLSLGVLMPGYYEPTLSGKLRVWVVCTLAQSDILQECEMEGCSGADEQTPTVWH